MNSQNQDELQEANTTFFNISEQAEVFAPLIVELICKTEIEAVRTVAISKLWKEIRKQGQAAYIYQLENEETHRLFVMLLESLAQNPNKTLATIVAGHCVVRAKYDQQFLELGSYIQIALTKQPKMAFQVLEDCCFSDYMKLKHCIQLDPIEILIENIANMDYAYQITMAFVNLICQNLDIFTGEQEQQIRKQLVENFIQILNQDLKLASKLAEAIDRMFQHAICITEELETFINLAAEACQADIDDSFKCKMIEIVSSCTQRNTELSEDVLLNFDQQIIIPLLKECRSLSEWTEDVENCYQMKPSQEAAFSYIEFQSTIYGIKMHKKLLEINDNDKYAQMLILYYQFQYLHELYDDDMLSSVLFAIVTAMKQNDLFTQYQAFVCLQEAVNHNPTFINSQNFEEPLQIASQLASSDNLRIVAESCAVIECILRQLNKTQQRLHADTFIQMSQFMTNHVLLNVKSSGMMIVSTLIEVLPRKKGESLLEQIIPTLLQNFKDYSTMFQSEYTLTKVQENLIGRELECLSICIVCHKYMFDDIIAEILQNLIIIARSSLANRNDVVISEATAAIRRISKNTSLISIIQSLYEFISDVYTADNIKFTPATDGDRDYEPDISSQVYKNILLTSMPLILQRQHAELKQFKDDLFEMFLETTVLCTENDVAIKQWKTQAAMINLLLDDYSQEQLQRIWEVTQKIFNEENPYYMTMEVGYMVSVPVALKEFVQVCIKLFHQTNDESIIQVIRGVCNLIHQQQQIILNQLNMDIKNQAEDGDEDQLKVFVVKIAADFRDFYLNIAEFYTVLFKEFKDGTLELINEFVQDTLVYRQQQATNQFELQKLGLCMSLMTDMIQNCSKQIVENEVLQYTNQLMEQFQDNANNTMLIYHMSKLIVFMKADLQQFKELWEETLNNITSTDFDSYLKIRIQIVLHLCDNSEFEIENGYGCQYASEIFEGNQKMLLVAQQLYGENNIWLSRMLENDDLDKWRTSMEGKLLNDEEMDYNIQKM